MIKTFEIILDLEKQLYNMSNWLFTVSRNDTENIEVSFIIMQDGAAVDLTGKTVEIAIKKPSGLTVYQNVNITDAVNGLASVKLSIQSYVEYGIHKAELYLRTADTMTVTCPFWYSSREAIMTSEEIDSVNDWGALQEALLSYDKKPLIIDTVPDMVPEYVGQTALDVVNKRAFIANDITAESWQILGSGEGTSGVVSWADVLNKPLTFTPAAHVHEIADVNGLQVALDDAAGSTVAWIDVTDKPLTFTPSTHAHTWGEITEKPLTFTPPAEYLTQTEGDNRYTLKGSDGGTVQPAEWGQITGDIGLQTDLQTSLDSKAPTAHTHAIADVTNLQTSLDSKAPTAHSHAIADVTGLQTSLDSKAPTGHNHAIADVTNLQTSLDAKAPTAHNHAIADVTNLQTSLDAKAPTAHSHAIADVTNLQASLDSKAPTAHTHAIADVTNLQTSLDSKADDADLTALQPKATIVTDLPTTAPTHAGQMAIDSAGGRTFIANGTTAAAWERLAETQYVDTADNFILNDVLSGLKLWSGTQAEYDAIPTKEATTLYFVTGA